MVGDSYSRFGHASGGGDDILNAGPKADVVVGDSYTETGVATGVNTNIRNIGGALGSQVSASILAAFTRRRARFRRSYTRTIAAPFGAGSSSWRPEPRSRASTFAS